MPPAENSRTANPTLRSLPGLSLTKSPRRSGFAADFLASDSLPKSPGLGSMQSCQLCNQAVDNTLGSEVNPLRHPSRFSACRRELNSHNAAKPRAAKASQQRAHGRACVEYGRKWTQRSTFIHQPTNGIVPSGFELILKSKKSCLYFVPHSRAGKTRYGLVLPALFPAHRHLQQETVGISSKSPAAAKLRRAKRVHTLGASLPNPSLNRSTNGRPPGPVWRYAVHFRQPGPGVPPLAPG